MHGFLVWAVGAVISAVLIGAGVSAIVSGTAQATVSAASGMGAAATAALSGGANAAGGFGSSTDYLIDTLVRSDRPDPAQGGDTARKAAADVALWVFVSLLIGA